MRSNKILFILFILFCFLKGVDRDELLLESARAYSAVSRDMTQDIQKIIKKSKAIIIFPSLKKVGLLFGGLGGSGVMVELNEDNAYEVGLVRMAGGGAGLQAGYSDSALVLFLINSALVQDIKSSKLVLKADMIAAFANVAANKGAIYGDIYAFSKDSGFFAGASLDAAVINFDGYVSNDNDGYAYNELMMAIRRQ